MDIKLKKSNKITKFIIALCVLLPAIILVSLYPTMEKAMLEKREEYQRKEEELREKEGAEVELVMEDTFINYAIEASYYMYGQLLNETQTESVDFSVLKYYGWVADYHRIYGDARIKASLLTKEGNEIASIENTAEREELKAPIGTLKLTFDVYGNLSNIQTEGMNVQYNRQYASIYETAMSSEKQYQDNVKEYNEEQGASVLVDELKPKNFTITFSVGENSSFLWDIMDNTGFYWQDDNENLYFEIGAYWLVAGFIVLVMMFAILLPFIKPLRTGREKIFSWPFEITCIVGMGVTGFIVFMGMSMSYVTMTELTEVFRTELLQFLGYEISVELVYKVLLGLSVAAWAICFFLVYMVTANLRQIFSHTKVYLKNQVLFVRFVKWLTRKCKQCYRYLTDIPIEGKMNKGILKIVIANFVILTLLCCTWFFGILGLIAYSVVIYILLRKEGEKIQKQYESILHATKQMANGELKISMEEDLGVFAPIGKSLEQVQQGFEKAVIEKANSQNMKNELISNVSHDLKTPLTAIITYVDLLKKEGITEEERKSYIATLDQKSQRLKVLIEDLFEVSKANSGNVKMNFMEVDVVSLLKQVRSEMDEQIEKSGLQFRFKFPEEKVMLQLDGQRTYRVFENLLSNALKYAMPNSRVYVDVNENNSRVLIQFRNVSAVELDFDAEHLTERFVRGDVARNTEGSGLGLAIAKSFVELQNGTFHIEIDGDLFKVSIVFYK